MIQLIDLNQSAEWDEIVKSFVEWDVYYLSGYTRPFQIHGDGDPYLLYYKGNNLRAIYVYMKRATALEGFFDAITPYGYGGVLFEGESSDEDLSIFWKEYIEKMCEEGIVDNFVRFHPILRNAVPMKPISNVIDLGRTIAMDLTSPEIIWENIASKNRNMIRKAEKNGIEICHGMEMSLLIDFQRIYNSTMDKDGADDYYYFKEPFYASIHQDLYDNYEVFYAVLDGQVIASSIILCGNNQMHYHLSGSMQEYRHLAPSNLLLYEAALWGCEQGFKTFHLGGGMGSKEDNLYKFKAAFNRYSNFQFSIGKEIFDQDRYDELVRIRRESDSDFDETSQFFPLYRAK